MKKPEWLKVRAATGDDFTSTREVLTRRHVLSVCDSSQCPNISECWSRGRATFMILGDRCTRECPFCSVEHGLPDGPVDEDEPQRVSEAVKDLALDHVVITSVTRDDLPDHGAGHFSSVVSEIRRMSPGTTIELLIPDLECSKEDLNTILRSGPDVIGHNIETVRRLQGKVRDGRASYDRSLAVLRTMGGWNERPMIKSSFLLGFGEDRQEISDTLRDLRGAGVDLLAIGQYLKPRGSDLEVTDYIGPSVFDEIGGEAIDLGFSAVASAPFVRSSFNAMEMFSMRSGGK